MIDLNHVVLIGRLTRDAELKYTAGGQAVCKFSIAVNRRKKSGDQWVDEPNFFDIVVWGRQGESINQYLVKGKLVGVDGELRQDRWEQDGQNRSRVEIVAANVQLLGGNPGGGGAYNGGSGSGGYSGGGYNGGSGGASGPGAGTSHGAPGNAGGTAGGDDGFTNDIPF
ncbi:MAG: single-stranded DNA-binding protein [Treponema sp.]|jgi:single-strand DNA-binding protein|nr:single-stranded DNA-binding protein [Treponema sp.]